MNKIRWHLTIEIRTINILTGFSHSESGLVWYSDPHKIIFFCNLRSPKIHSRSHFLCSGDLNTKLVQYSNSWKEAGHQMVQFSGQPDNLNIDKWTPSNFLGYCSSIWMVGLVHKTKHIDWTFKYSGDLNTKWSSIWMPFEKWTPFYFLRY